MIILAEFAIKEISSDKYSTGSEEVIIYKVKRFHYDERCTLHRVVVQKNIVQYFGGWLI